MGSNWESSRLDARHELLRVSMSTAALSGVCNCEAAPATYRLQRLSAFTAGVLKEEACHNSASGYHSLAWPVAPSIATNLRGKSRPVREMRRPEPVWTSNGARTVQASHGRRF